MVMVMGMMIMRMRRIFVRFLSPFFFGGGGVGTK